MIPQEKDFSNNRNKGPIGAVPLVLLCLGALILLVRAFYSFCWSDESFYFSTAYRFYLGDSIFKHDWFPTQLSGIIILPFLSLYLSITGSTEGIILFFRILYLILSFLNSLLVFFIMKRHKPLFSAAAMSVCTLFFAHLNIATLSYYTISVQCFLSAMLLIYDYLKKPVETGDQKKTVPLTLVFAGVFYALSVLALPTMALAYVLIVIILLSLILIRNISKKKAETGSRRDSHGFISSFFENNAGTDRLPSILIYTFAGILIPALAFFIFLLSNVSIPDFIRNIPYVLSDDEHGTSLIYPLKKFFIGINEVYGVFAYAGYLLILLSFLLMFIPKEKREKAYIWKYSVILLDILLFTAYFIKGFGHTGYIQTAVCLFSLPLFFLTEKKDFHAFFTFFLNGLVFSLVYSYSSNGYLYILSMGHFIASMAAFCFISDFISELSSKSPGSLDKALTLIFMLILLSVVIETAVLRVINIYRDAPLSDLTAKITEGPARGLYTTPEHLRLYNDVNRVIKENCGKEKKDDGDKESQALEDEEKTLFISKLLPWGYLSAGLDIGAPTTWRIELGSDRLKEYYDLNPDKLPDIVLLLNEEYGSYDTCGDVEADPSPNLNEDTEGFLPDYMKENNYTLKEVPCGFIYERQ